MRLSEEPEKSEALGGRSWLEVGRGMGLGELRPERRAHPRPSDFSGCVLCVPAWLTCGDSTGAVGTPEHCVWVRGLFLLRPLCGPRCQVGSGQRGHRQGNTLAVSCFRTAMPTNSKHVRLQVERIKSMFFPGVETMPTSQKLTYRALSDASLMIQSAAHTEGTRRTMSASTYRIPHGLRFEQGSPGATPLRMAASQRVVLYPHVLPIQGHRPARYDQLRY